MANPQVEAILAFRALPKFRCTEPQFRSLTPPPPEVAEPLERTVNDCATELASLLERGAPSRQLVATIENSLRSVERPYALEDRQYLAHYYAELAALAGVKVGWFLKGWLHGITLAFLLRIFR